jgi:ribulose-phosphate 3-epimerase
MVKEIHPTLFALDLKTFEKKLELLKFAPKLHIDFMDGTLTEKKSVSFKEINTLVKKYNNLFECHIMSKKPIEYIEHIKNNQNIEKILIHYCSFYTDKTLGETIIKNFKKLNRDVFLCFNPNINEETIILTLTHFYKKLKLISGIQLMSVFPGAEGQKFIEDTYKKIKEIKFYFPNLLIQVDGGVKEDNIKKLKQIGVDIFSIGSCISSNSNPKEIYKKLLYLINN